MVVKLTQEQADYLKTFVCNDRAFHYISRYGWNHYLKDGNGKCYEKNTSYRNNNGGVLLYDGLLDQR